MKLRYINLSSILAIALFTGCAGQQAINNVSGDMFYTKLGVPTGNGSAIGAVFALGRINATEILQATSTNQVYAPAVAIAVTGHGKQDSSGNAGTNNGVAITDGSSDTAVLTTGNSTVNQINGTNKSLSVSGNK